MSPQHLGVSEWNKKLNNQVRITIKVILLTNIRSVVQLVFWNITASSKYRSVSLRLFKFDEVVFNFELLYDVFHTSTCSQCKLRFNAICQRKWLFTKLCKLKHCKSSFPPKNDSLFPTRNKWWPSWDNWTNDAF